jgi:hypothetical protein
MVVVIVTIGQKDRNVCSLQNLSEFYTAKTVDSLCHLYGRGKHHDRIKEDVLEQVPQTSMRTLWLYTGSICYAHVMGGVRVGVVS